MAVQMMISKKELDNKYGSGGGLEIRIEGCIGDPSEEEPGTAIFIEHYEGKYRVHIWNDTQDPTSITLKECPKKKRG